MPKPPRGAVSALCHLSQPAGPPGTPPADAWTADCARARQMGFDALVLDGKIPADPAPLVAGAAEHGLAVLFDLPPEQVESDLEDCCAAGAAGFRCLAAHEVPAAVWRQRIAGIRALHPRTLFLAFTHGAPAAAVAALAPCGFDGGASSSCWWDFRSAWIDEDGARVSALGPVLALPRPIPAERTNNGRDRQRALVLAACYGPLWLTDLAFTAGLEPAVTALNARRRAEPALFAGPPARLVSAPGAEVAVLARGTPQAPGLVLAINPAGEHEARLPAASVLPDLGGAGGALADGETRIEAGDAIILGPGEARVLRFTPNAPIRRPVRRRAERAAATSRIAIERIRPAVDDGRFPARRIVGETVRVETDLIADGHGRLAADLLWRPADSTSWRRVPMAPLGNDRYAGALPLARLGRHLFTIEAWHDAFASLVEDMAKKQAAGQPVALEAEEACALVRRAAERSGSEALADLARALGSAAADDRPALLARPESLAAMRADGPRDFLERHDPPLPVEAERPAAGFASWYELFPRNQSGDPARHGTFADVIRRLPEIRAMGFDVLYFPPIHPIGRIHRKGRNNALKAAPDDPGSPYAIGAEEGGHDAIHPALGTLADFHRLRDAAAAEGLELALDFAIQCAPDHPWVKEHPEWFEWRPDGTIRYAENPPKRYEDIVNVAFHAPGAVPSLWHALRDVVRFWLDQGVRTFRVDNPHTKPLPFWDWLIDDIRSREPDAIFLAEAFTRPAMMYRLAKGGFSQSYTYFTWRNTKHELTSYFTELAGAPVADFFRPHLFVNTPDINPVFLQQGGRPSFLIRAALAATLSGLWGVYSGFELCEAQALPGREEYQDSEKYQLRAWDWDRPGNIKAEIARLNRIRRANPALHSHRGVEFLNAFHDDVLYYLKMSVDRRNAVLVAVNLDPHHAAEADIEIPLWHFGLPDDAALDAEELMSGRRITWQGKRQRIRLDPTALPFAIWRLEPPASVWRPEPPGGTG